MGFGNLRQKVQQSNFANPSQQSTVQEQLARLLRSTSQFITNLLTTDYNFYFVQTESPKTFTALIRELLSHPKISNSISAVHMPYGIDIRNNLGALKTEKFMREFGQYLQTDNQDLVASALGTDNTPRLTGNIISDFEVYALHAEQSGCDANVIYFVSVAPSQFPDLQVQAFHLGNLFKTRINNSLKVNLKVVAYSNIPYTNVDTIIWKIPYRLDDDLLKLYALKIANIQLPAHLYNSLTADMIVELADTLRIDTFSDTKTLDEKFMVYIRTRLEEYDVRVHLPSQIKTDIPIGQKRLYELADKIISKSRAQSQTVHNHDTAFLLYGIPATGKSTFAKVIAKKYNLPLVEFNLGMIRSQLVGESEHRMREVLNYVTRVRHAVFWIDEIGRQFAGDRGEVTDSGVTKTLIAQFLQWFQEEKPPETIIVATSNEIGSLSDALLRRFKLKIKFDFIPDHIVPEITRYYARKYINNPVQETIFVTRFLELNTKPLTPADIDAIVSLYTLGVFDLEEILDMHAYVYDATSTTLKEELMKYRGISAWDPADTESE